MPPSRRSSPRSPTRPRWPRPACSRTRCGRPYAHAPSDDWKRALGTTPELTVGNIPALDGTLVVIDTSGSMEAPVSNRSKVARVEVAAVMAMATAKRASDVDVVIYGEHNQRLKSIAGESVLAGCGGDDDGPEVSMMEPDSELYVMGADGSGPTNLSNHPGHDRNNPVHDRGPVWSPDGTRIAFETKRFVRIEPDA